LHCLDCWFVECERVDDAPKKKTSASTRAPCFVGTEDASVHVVDDMRMDWLVGVDGCSFTWIAATV